MLVINAHAELVTLALADALTRRRHQGGIDGLITLGNIAVTVQLLVHAQALSKPPDGVALRGAHAILQQAKALSSLKRVTCLADFALARGLSEQVELQGPA